MVVRAVEWYLSPDAETEEGAGVAGGRVAEEAEKGWRGVVLLVTW